MLHIGKNGFAKTTLKLFARDIMSSPITNVEYNKSITDTLKIMCDKHIRKLAVTQEGKVIGIVTQRRILSVLVLV